MVSSKFQKNNIALRNDIKKALRKAVKKQLIPNLSLIAINTRTTPRTQLKTLEKVLFGIDKHINENKKISWASIQRTHEAQINRRIENYEPEIINPKQGVNLFSTKNKTINNIKPPYNRSVNITVYVKMGNENRPVRVFSLVNINNYIVENLNIRFNKNIKDDALEKFLEVLARIDPETEKIISTILNSVEGFIVIEDKGRIQERRGMNFKKKNVRRETANKNMFKYIKYSTLPINDDLKNLFVKDVNDYVKENYEGDSCLFTEIINIYKTSFDKNNDNKQLKFQLTYETLYELVFNKPFIKGVAHEATLEDMTVFFSKFRLSCVAFNIDYKIVYKYHPVQDDLKINRDISPETCYLLIHDGHVEAMNHGLKSLAQIIEKYKNEDDSDEEDEDENDKKLDDYHIQKDNEDKIYTYCQNMNEFVRVIAGLNLDEEKDRKINIDYAGDIHELLNHFILNLRYNPKLKIMKKSICGFSFVANDNIINVRQAGFNPDNMTVIFEDEEQYLLYETFYKKMYKALISPHTKSNYNSEFINVLDNIKCYPITGMWHENVMKMEEERDDTNNKLFGYDIQKCFTSALMEMKFLPVFNRFDTWQKYNGEEIQDYSFYVVEHREDDVNDPDYMIMPKRYNVVVGYVINKRDMHLDVLYKATPYKLVKNDTPKIIEDIYKSKLHLHHKKNMVNIVIGMLSKRKHSFMNSIYTDDADEGHQLNKDNKNPLCVFGEGEGKRYCVLKTHESELRDGFMPISTFIHNIACLKMAELMDKILLAGGKPLCIKTDCIVVDEPCLEIEKIKVNYEGFAIKEHAEKYYNIGNIRMEEDKKMQSKRLQFFKNGYFIGNTNTKINKVKVDDEWDKKQVVEAIDQNNRLIVKGNVAGAGKSQACKDYIDSVGREKGLFITPYGNLGCELIKEGYNAITLHSLLGILLNDTMNEEKAKPFDVSEIDVIVFDEVYCHATGQLERIMTYMDKHKEKKFLATGDSNQLEPIGEKLNVKDKAEYYDYIIGVMFPNQIFLQDSKRLKNKEDQERLKQVKYDIFSGEMSMKEVIYKHFEKNIINNLEDMKGYGVCTRNKTVDAVNNYQHKKQKCNQVIKVNINDVLYYKGLELVCRKHLIITKTEKKQIVSKQRYIINHTYKIKKVSKTEFLLEDWNNNEYTLNTNFLSYFSLNYARTGYSVQGITICGAITIFNIQDFMFSPRHFYTALSRVRYLEDVFIYIDDNDEMNVLEEEQLFIKNCIWKIKGYEMSDKKKTFKWEEREYVDVAWITKKMYECEGVCYRCHCELEYMKYGFREEKQFSVNRLDNNKPHTKDNCELICFNCNRNLK
jgi:hypothetical protein